MSTLRKNVSGQYIYFQGVKTADGTAFTDVITTKIVSKDGGASAAMAGVVSHLANGLYRVSPTQADTNADFLGYNFGATGMVPVTANFITVGYDPHATNLASDVQAWLGSAPNALQAGRVDAYVGAFASGVVPANFADLGITPIIGAIVRTDQIGEVAAGAITSASYGAGAITASAIAANALNGKGDWLLASTAPANFSDMSIKATTGIVAGNVMEVNDSSADANQLQKALSAQDQGSVNDAGATATTFITTLTATDNDTYKGRLITFRTANLSKQSAVIEAYNGTTKAVTVTVDHLTNAPNNGSEFVIT